MCNYLDVIKYVIYAIMILILVIGIAKSMKIKKLGYFLVAVLLDLLLFLGIILLNSSKICKEEKKETPVNSNVKTTQDKTVTTSEQTTTTDNVKRTKNGFKIEEIDGITYIDGVLVVNKTYSLPKDYIPTDTYSDPGNQKYCQTCLKNEVYNAYKEMKADASALGLNIYIASGYRSYAAQDGLYNSYVNKDGKAAADRYSARPGNSEHQTGLAFDLNTVTDDFAYTAEGKWIAEVCYKYGFVIRYPKEKEDITGYKYEPWHLRYLGKDLAAKLYNNGNPITLEEYFGITSEYPSE